MSPWTANTLIMRSLSIMLCGVVLLQPLVGQTTLGQAETYAREPLTINVVRGSGTVNNVRKRAMSEAAVEIKDREGRPVSAAAVSFILPTQGASGEFSNGSKSITIQSDNAGLASVGFKPNSATGPVEIRVNATRLGHSARAVITQNNMVVPGTGGSAGKVAAILAIIGGAAAGSVYAFTQSQSKSTVTPSAAATAPPPIVITPGTGTAGPPF